MTADYIAIGGGAAGLLAFILAISKIYAQDKIWRGLIDEVRSELRDCREGRASADARVATLEGEVITLRRELHVDRWLGVDPLSRPRPDAERGDQWVRRSHDKQQGE